MFDAEGEINYPQVKKEALMNISILRLRTRLLENLHGIYWNRAYVNSLLEVLESCLTYVPSSGGERGTYGYFAFDHLKLTAAIASCIYQYAKEAVVTDYREASLCMQRTFIKKKRFSDFFYGCFGHSEFYIYDFF